MFKIVLIMALALTACGRDETTTSVVNTSKETVTTVVERLTEEGTNTETSLDYVKQIIINAYMTGCLDAKPKNAKKCDEKAEAYLAKILPDEQDN